MKRRNLLKGIAVVSAGAIIFPMCKPGVEPIAIPVFDNLTIDANQFNLLAEVSEFLLPKKDLNIINPEPVNEFILNMVNDCHPIDDCQKFADGLKSFDKIILDNHQKKYSELTLENRTELFEYISEIKNKANPLKFFFDKTLQYSKQHFTGSEYFLTKHLDWKFLPGEYKGCEPV